MAFHNLSPYQQYTKIDFSMPYVDYFYPTVKLSYRLIYILNKTLPQKAVIYCCSVRQSSTVSNL